MELHDTTGVVCTSHARGHVGNHGRRERYMRLFSKLRLIEVTCDCTISSIRSTTYVDILSTLTEVYHSFSRMLTMLETQLRDFSGEWKLPAVDSDDSPAKSFIHTITSASPPPNLVTMDPSYPDFILNLVDSQEYSNFQDYKKSSFSNHNQLPGNIQTSQNTRKQPKDDK
ncbi:hypothetical protein LXL04_034315 [Taraxacum kok-saghyz]